MASSIFNRGLQQSFIDILKAEADAGGWWRDVLDDPDLMIGIRENCFDVYWNGARLFHGYLKDLTRLVADTHKKYLRHPHVKGHGTLDGETYTIDLAKEEMFITEYKKDVTIGLLKAAARSRAKVEKRGCHAIALNNGAVIDCEIEVSSGRNRIDVVSLEEHGSDARLVFWEVKHYTNDDIRSEGVPKVCEQIARYRERLMEIRDPLIASYKRVVGNLASVHEMGWTRRHWSSLIADVQAGTRNLVVGDRPKLGLIVFGFDGAQKNQWRRERDALEQQPGFCDNADDFVIKAAGDAKDIKL